MEKSTLISMVVGASVAVILLASFLVPIITDAQTTTYTYDNSQIASELYNKIDGAESYVVEFGDVYTINGEEITERITILTNICWLYVDPDNLTGVFWNGTTYLENMIEVYSGFTLTADSIVLNGDTPATYDLAWGLISDENGDYGRVATNGAVIKDISEVYFVYGDVKKMWSLTDGVATWFHATDGVSVDLRYTLTETSHGLYEIEFPWYADFPVVASMEWAYIPIHGSVEIENSYGGLLLVLPMIVILGIIVAVATSRMFRV